MRLPRERFDYSPLPARKPWKLPKGARIAVWTIVNVEEWDVEKAMARQYLTTPQRVAVVPDVPNWAWHDYGMRVGFWRLLEALRKRKIRATTAINARVVESYEPVARAMLEAGWEFMGHGVVQGAMHLLPDQRAAIREAVELLEKFTGKKPRGWLGPGLTETWRRSTTWPPRASSTSPTGSTTINPTRSAPARARSSPCPTRSSSTTSR